MAGVPRKIYSLRTGKGTERAVGGRMVSGGGSSYIAQTLYIHIHFRIKADTHADNVCRTNVESAGIDMLSDTLSHASRNL
ncbi:unnamed protein product [Lasius platythorax]|uniref:Uncharacterized protein n=1 Tax=Lasius platythorax TaxID=488582 RepID=A0AAV2NYQ9_9HYME